MGYTTVFLGWGRPLVDLAVERLAAEWDEGFLDLSAYLLVVPTLGSGRRLRERIATFAAGRGGAALPARIVTPDFFLLAETDRRGVAPKVAELGAWMLALRQAGPEETPNLFPLPDEGGDDFRWAMAAAKKLSRLKKLLGENGLSIAATLAGHGGLLAADAERWGEMAALERRYLEIMAGRGLRDADEAKRASMPAPGDLRQFSKLALVGVTDPLPLLRRKFEALAALMPVEAWVGAPESLRGHFDAWGAPIPERWEEFRPPLRDFEDSVCLVGTPEGQAEAAVDFLLSKGEGLDAASVAVMSPDEKLYPFLERAFSRRGVATFNPAARRLDGTGTYALLAAFRELLANGGYDAFAALVRHPDFTGHCRRLQPDFDFSGLDDLQNKRLPVSFAAFKDALRRERGLHDSPDKLGQTALDSLSLAVAEADKFAALFESGPFPGFVRGFLAEIHAGRKLDAARSADNAFIEVAGLVNALLDEIDSSSLAQDLRPPDLFALFLDVLKDGLVYPDRPPDAFDVQGWLELAFEPAPVLVVCGLNEGFVPDKVEDDGFLPESVRAALGIRDDRTRFARDAFLFSAALAWRRPGDLRCVVGKTDANGDPLLPSRLLFLRGAAEMPAWAAKLFAEAPAGRPGLAQDVPAWLLSPERLELPVRLPVTAFKQYLECPFRFYLKRVARMEKADDRKMELDQLDFGNLCHAVMEGFGKDLSVRDSDDAGEICAWLQRRLDALMAGLYGHDLPLAPLVQREALRRRLAAVAAVQAADRAEGWRIVEAERDLKVQFEGLTVTGKIDRVDRRGDCFRLLDYKTSDSVKRPAPQAAHYVAVKKPELQPPYAVFELDGKACRWLDLQLPLYRVLTADSEPFKGRQVSCGYFNIPKALSDTGITLWDGLDGACLEAARRCAAAVADQVRRGVFWPPADKLPFDEFEELWPGSPLECVAPGWMEVAP